MLLSLCSVAAWIGFVAFLITGEETSGQYTGIKPQAARGRELSSKENRVEKETCLLLRKYRGLRHRVDRVYPFPVSQIFDFTMSLSPSLHP